MPENEKIESAMTQFLLIDSLSSIYLSMHIIDLEKNTSVEYNASSAIREVVTKNTDADKTMIAVMKHVVVKEHQEAAIEFTDLHTVAERMRGKQSITTEFISTNWGWCRARFIRINDRSLDELPARVIFATEVIDEEKRREENLIRISLTDELTTLLNRRAYEEELKLYTDLSKTENFTYISMDLNGLKRVNDSIGHAAGDELIVEAVKIIRASMGRFGKVFRTGGDEFQAILFVDVNKIDEVTKNMCDMCDAWKGEYSDTMSISFGVASQMEFPNKNVRELGKIADKRMYKNKDEYYKRTGLDRRK